MVDPTVSVWDTCAVSVIVEAAGGRFTDFRGERGHTFGEAITSTPGVFNEVIAAFSIE
jgi:fructose-1,6-bisphosphatase/inositol monophosphatase family enzyme